MSSYGTGLDIGEFEAAVDLNNAYTFAVISQKKINLPLAGGYADGIIFEPYKFQNKLYHQLDSDVMF